MGMRHPRRMTEPNPYAGIHVTTQPGLSSAAHAINVVLSVLSCGFWLPLYLLIVLASPPKRVMLSAAAGTPPHLIDEARRAALQLTPAEQGALRSRNIGLGVAAGVIALILVLAFAIVALNGDWEWQG